MTAPASNTVTANTSLSRRALKTAARTCDALRQPTSGITILIYHRVGASSGGQMNLVPSEFERQVEWLAATQRVVDLDTALDEVTKGGPIQAAVALTFDDGTADWIDIAAPILLRHNVPATFYLTTGYPQGDVPLPDGERAISWASVRDLSRSGIASIGSHTHTHRLLDRLVPDELDAELDRSIELIGEHVGSPPQHFAYPKAVDPSPMASSAVGSRFRSAALAGTRANIANGDPYRLSRSPIQAADSFTDFKRKVAGGMGLEDSVRRLANRYRYRRASS